MHDLYRANILDHYHNPRNYGRMINADITYEMDNPLCGDRIGVDIKFQDKEKKIISQIKFWGEGCAISLSTASMLTEKLKKEKKTRVLLFRKEDIIKMLGINLSPTRLRCALLPLEVIHKALTLV